MSRLGTVSGSEGAAKVAPVARRRLKIVVNFMVVVVSSVWRKFDRCLIGFGSCSGLANGYLYAIECLSSEKIDHTKRWNGLSHRTMA